MRLTEKDEVIRILFEKFRAYWQIPCSASDMAIQRKVCEVRDKINNAPTIDPEELRPKGRWEDKEPLMLGLMCRCRCSLCGSRQDYQHNYCPNCGAKMEEDK